MTTTAVQANITTTGNVPVNNAVMVVESVTKTREGVVFIDVGVYRNTTEATGRNRIRSTQYEVRSDDANFAVFSDVNERTTTLIALATRWVGMQFGNSTTVRF